MSSPCGAIGASAFMVITQFHPFPARCKSAPFRVTHTGYPGHYTQAFAFCIILCPLPVGIGFTLFRLNDNCEAFRCRQCTGGAMFVLDRATAYPAPRPLPFGLASIGFLRYIHVFASNRNDTVAIHLVSPCTSYLGRLNRHGAISTSLSQGLTTPPLPAAQSLLRSSRTKGRLIEQSFKQFSSRTQSAIRVDTFGSTFDERTSIASLFMTESAVAPSYDLS